MSGTGSRNEVRMEIIKVVPRRRRTAEQKISMIEESMQPVLFSNVGGFLYENQS